MGRSAQIVDAKVQIVRDDHAGSIPGCRGRAPLWLDTGGPCTRQRNNMHFLRHLGIAARGLKSPPSAAADHLPIGAQIEQLKARSRRDAA